MYLQEVLTLAEVKVVAKGKVESWYVCICVCVCVDTCAPILNRELWFRSNTNTHSKDSARRESYLGQRIKRDIPSLRF